ncbi:kinase [Rheinheimera sp.]|uniref:kinase n=1 Tax=Rheinheimera sp. TaxID=1869214 RepID=UPI00307DB13E
MPSVSSSGLSFWFRILESFSLKQPLPMPTEDRPVILALSAAQGSGKSTLCRKLQQQWQLQGVKVAVVSLDDYYLDRAARTQLAQQIHPLCLQRGVPGTHHIHQLIEDLHAFQNGQAVAWRRFDKGTEQSWLDRPELADLLVLEGWCLGLPAQPEQDLLQPVNALEQLEDSAQVWRRWVNQHLAGPYQQLNALADELLWLQAPDWPTVCRWRAEQEQALWQQGLGQSPAGLARFMLYYERLTRFSPVLAGLADCQLQLGPQRQWLQLSCRHHPVA